MKLKLRALVALAISCVGVAPTYAVNDYSKCPDTWKLTSKSQVDFDREIQEARAVLGTSLATSLVSQEILDGDKWRVFMGPGKNTSPEELSLLPLMRLPMRSTYKIEVKGCTSTLEYSIDIGIQNINVVRSSYESFVQDVNSIVPQADWIRFYDFKQEESAFSSLKALIEQNKKNLAKGTANPSGIFWYNNGKTERVIHVQKLKPIGNAWNAAGGPRMNIELVPEKLDCIALSSGLLSTSNRKPLQFPDRFVWITSGYNCNYQVVARIRGNDRYPDTMFVLDSVTLATPKPNIYCQNLKKSTALIPIKKGNCPRGSKKVS